MTLQFLVSIAIHLPFKSEVIVLEVRMATSVIPPVHNLCQCSFVFIILEVKIPLDCCIVYVKLAFHRHILQTRLK